MKKGNKKLVIIIFAVVLVAAVIGLLVWNNIKNYKATYKPYSDKVETFGFNQRYYDGDSNSYKDVKKGEAIGLVLSAVYNTNNIIEIGYNPLFEDKNSAWVRYAEVEGVIPESSINKDNVAKKVTMLEVITYLGKCKELFLDQELDTKTELKLRGIKKLNKDDVKYLKDAVAMGIIKNEGSFNANKKIKRGEFNKIVIDYMFKCSKAVALGAEIEENQANMPKNSADYPFIIKGIEKSLYEIPFKQTLSLKIQKPREVYSSLKDISTIAEESVKKYFDLLLNVDYKTINSSELETKYKELMQFFPNVEMIKPYADYVVANKLEIKGSATPLWPIIYYDGDMYRIRTKVEFEVIQGDTKDNILLGDTLNGKTNTYEGKNSFIVDVPVEYGISSHKLYTNIFSLKDSIVK